MLQALFDILGSMPVLRLLCIALEAINEAVTIPHIMSLRTGVLALKWLVSFAL